jgi:ribosome biogenesis protein Tsr3
MPGPHTGYPVTSFSLTTALLHLRQFDPSNCSAGRKLTKPAGPDNFQITYDWISRVLNAAADSLVVLKDKVKVEVICAELFSSCSR